MADKQKALMWVMFVVIVLLAVIVVYAFLIKPAISGYVIDKQNEGISFCVSNIMSQVQQTGGVVQLPMADGGTLVLQATQVIPPQQAPLQ